MEFMSTKAINPFLAWWIVRFFLFSFPFFCLVFVVSCFSIFHATEKKERKERKKEKKDFIRSGSNPLDVCVFLIPMAPASDTQQLW